MFALPAATEEGIEANLRPPEPDQARAARILVASAASFKPERRAIEAVELVRTWPTWRPEWDTSDGLERAYEIALDKAQLQPQASRVALAHKVRHEAAASWPRSGLSDAVVRRANDAVLWARTWRTWRPGYDPVAAFHGAAAALETDPHVERYELAKKAINGARKATEASWPPAQQSRSGPRPDDEPTARTGPT